jgi:hypothetical protein
VVDKTGMKKLIALSIALSACSTAVPKRTPSSVESRAPVAIDILCGSDGATVQHATIDLPRFSDCNTSVVGGAYYRIDCSAHPIRLAVGNDVYVSQHPTQDLVFQGACGVGKSVKSCADLSGVNFNSLDQSSPGGRAPQFQGVNYDVPELQLLKDRNGGSVELIVGKSADELEAKGVFRGCVIKY